jgi:large subunit ribosomal protein L25
MQELSVELQPRKELGSRPAKRLRNRGLVPAVIYGKGFNTAAVTVQGKALREILSTESGVNSLINVKVNGNKHLCLIRGLQKDPIKRIINHVDFLVVDPEKPVSFEVPLVLTGEPTELNKMGGRVEQLLFKLTIKAAPSNIPASLELDISQLTLGGSLKASDVKLPVGVTCEVDPDVIVVVGQASRLSRLRTSQDQQESENQQEQ